MNILLITPMLHQGGFERVCVATARLLEQKHNVTIAVFSMEDIAFDIEGLDVVDLNIPAQDGIINKIRNMIARGRAISKLEKQKNIDVTMSLGITANRACSFAGKGVRRIMACHSFEEITNRTYMKLVGAHSDVLVSCAEKMTAIIKENYSFKHAVTLWNPIDPQRIVDQSKFRPDDFSFFENNEHLIVTMGREDDVKGYWHLIKIFKEVCESYPDARLAIIGDGEFTEYKELVHRIGIDERVMFTGNKRNPFPYVKAGSVYAMTSISEGLPMALVEALAIGVPVVSVNCKTGPAEILHSDMAVAEGMTEGNYFCADYGILTPELSPVKNLDEFAPIEDAEKAMANAIISLWEDETLKEKYIAAGPRRASDFSGESYLAKLEELFKDNNR